jgi:hypothetical protein
MDGERDLFEIAKKVQLQTGFSFELESILEYVKLLKKYDISRWSSV